jgi:uncharacterized protein (DUF924 family)
VDRNQPAPGESFKRWFMSTPEFDSLIKEKFHDDIKKLASGEYEAWKADRNGKLAAIILVD